MTAALLSGLAAQSTLVAVLGLGGLWLLRRRSPLDRAAWLKLALVLLLAMPLLPRFSLTVPHALEGLMPAPAPTVADIAPTVTQPDQPLPQSLPPVTRPTIRLSTLLMLAYGLGVAALLGRLLLGVALLSSWTRRAAPLQDHPWRQALALSGAPASTRLVVSGKVGAPLSWGLRHPTIMIDPASARRPGDASAILAHEAAHIAHGDWLALMAARVAVALFWFNPLVWVLTRALVQHCEEAADAQALTRCAPTDYAETLMTCLSGCLGAGRLADHARLLPANGMAAGHGLSRRVHQVLEAAPADLLRRSRFRVAGLGGIATLAVAASLVSFAHAAQTSAQTPEAPQPKTTRIVHPDGTVETRSRAANGDTTIDVLGRDGHQTHIRLSANNGHRVSVVSQSANNGGYVETPVPPAPPAPPAAPAPYAAPMPPAPPAPPAPPYVGSREEGPLSRADVDRIRADAMRQAAQARAEGLAAAAEGRAQTAAARIEAQTMARQARQEALVQAEQARREADQSRREALAQAAQARHEALAEAAQARREAQAARRAAMEND